MTIGEFLALLDNVRRYGDGYRATCPAHGNGDNTALSVHQGNDGRILAHCFAGCPTSDVTAAVGIELADLFPERLSHHLPPDKRREVAARIRMAEWKAALGVILDESMVIAIGGCHRTS